MSSESPKPRLLTIRSSSPSSRIFLRSPIHTDAYSLLVRVQDPECTTYLPHLRSPKIPITLASNQKQVKTWRAASGITEFFLVVVLLPDPTSPDSHSVSEPGDPYATIGDTGLAPLDLDSKTAEVGIMLNSGPAIRGRGLAVEALDMCYTYGFEHLGLERITSATHKDNIPMRSLLENKFGLEAEWREQRNEWGFTATKEWWNARVAEKGDSKIILEVEETTLDENDRDNI